MSWFDAKTFSNYAKTALKQAQKNIDKVLDIKDEVVTDSLISIPTTSTSTSYNHRKVQPPTVSSASNLSTDTFFDSFFENSQAVSKKKDKLSHVLSTPNDNFEKSNNESERPNKQLPSNEWADFSIEATLNSSVTKVTNNLDGTIVETIKPIHSKNKKDNSLINISLNEKNSLVENTADCLQDDHSRDLLNVELTVNQINDAEKSSVNDIQNQNSIPLNQKSEDFIIEDQILNTENKITSDFNHSLDNSLISSDILGNTYVGQEKSTEEKFFDLETDLEKKENNLCANNHEKYNNIPNSKQDDNSNHHDNIPYSNPHETVYKILELDCLDQKTEITFNSDMNNSSGNENEPFLLNKDIEQYKDVIKLTEESEYLDFHQTHHNDSSQFNVLEYTEEIAQLKCILEARENKMVELSHENIRLNELNSAYKIQLEQCETLLKQKNKTDEESFNQLKKTLNETESKFQLVIKERDALKQKLATAEQQIQKSEKDLQLSLTQSVAEKEETIKALLEEGEALSKKELENNIKIKKLRVKLKEFMTKNDKLSTTIGELNTEIQKVNDMLVEKEKENQQQEAEILKLQKMTDLQEDEITALKESIDENDEKYKAMETSIQVAYSEINRLNLEKAQMESEVNEGHAAIAMKKELELKIRDLERLSSFDREELQRQMDDLQMAYSRLEQQSARQENYLKREIQDLLKRLEEGENRNQELLQSVSTATKPLLRQIENLQTSHSKHVENWERVEFNLTSRLGDMQQQLALATEKERSATELAEELKAKCKALEVEFRRVKQEKSICDEILEEEQSKRKSMEEVFKREKSQNNDIISNLKKMYDGILNEKSLLEDQLATERLHHEHEISQLTFNRSNVQSSSLSRQISTDSLVKLDDTGPSQKNSFIQLYPDTLPNSIQDWSSSMRSTTTTASLEHIDIQLRKRDGELFLLREEVNSLERTRASLARDLVSATSKLEELEMQSQELQFFKIKYEELSNRYNAMLQMYGEKEEENEELKMDLEDIKALYKQQVQELLLSGR
ncbi:TATA element modulatory factor isoform X2 [Hydra vulgaris]|uniref:TATA element modulatory factor isoform X2 n=1 Tax=Hydra vulgaris TaxID=6087 RepID=A0ABM4CET9_HYDVU